MWIAEFLMVNISMNKKEKRTMRRLSGCKPQTFMASTFLVLTMALPVSAKTITTRFGNLEFESG